MNGETLEIEQHRRGTLWCPFCDHSTFDTERLCKKCGAVFSEKQAPIYRGYEGEIPHYQVEDVVEVDQVSIGGLPTDYDIDTLPSTVTTTNVTSLKILCSVEGCGRLISARPAAQANHRKKHEREAAK